jgi:hypothetical protein
MPFPHHQQRRPRSSPCQAQNDRAKHHDNCISARVDKTPLNRHDPRTIHIDTPFPLMPRTDIDKTSFVTTRTNFFYPYRLPEWQRQKAKAGRHTSPMTNRHRKGNHHRRDLNFTPYTNHSHDTLPSHVDIAARRIEVAGVECKKMQKKGPSCAAQR